VTQAPALETERLKLRAHQVGDFTALAAMWADPVVTRHIGGKPATSEESWTRLLRYAGHWALLGFGYWALEEKATGLYAGETGFADYKRILESPLINAPEIGWVIAPAFHGKGYATEAVRAVVAWGDAHFGPVQTTCLIDPENRASIRVAEKCGYRELQPAVYKDKPSLIFVR
jgi:RimJ/RimL family protein N-acetyltransferase